MSILNLNRDVFNEYNTNYNPVGLRDFTKGLEGLFNSSALANEPMSIEDFQTQNIEELPPVASIPSNFLNYRFQNARTPFTPIREGITTLRNQIGNLKDSGIDLGKMIGRGIGNAIFPGLGFLIGNVKETPEQKAMRNFYESEFGLTDTGQVASGIMQGYNPVSLFGGVGLNQAIDKRIAKINQTLAKQKKNKSKVLENRLKELKELRAKESAAASAALEAQRRGRRPGTGGDGPRTGGDGPGVKDSGGIGGGYSYDSGGREGFGYGL